jgi:hypothetical protein
MVMAMVSWLQTCTMVEYKPYPDPGAASNSIRLLNVQNNGQKMKFMLNGHDFCIFVRFL